MTAVRLTSITISTLTAVAAALGVVAPPEPAGPGATEPVPRAEAVEVPWATTSSMRPATVSPGDLVGVEIDVELPAEGIVWDLAVRATLPDGLRYVGGGTALCTDPEPCDVPEGTSLVPSGGEMAWFFDDLAPRAGAERLHLTVDYVAQVEPDAVLGVLTAVAQVTANRRDRIDTPFSAGDLGPGELVGPVATASVTVVAPTPTDVRLGAYLSTSLVDAGNGAEEATIGERVRWIASAQFREGAVLDDLVLTVEVPEGLGLLEPGSAEPPAVVSRSGPTPPGTSVQVDGTRVRVTVPDGWVVPAGGTVLTLLWATDVLDLPSVRAGTSLTVAPVVTATVGGTPVGAEATAAVEVVEPAISVSRGNNSGSLQAGPGSWIQMSTTAWNASGASTAHDVRVVDAMPVSLHPLDPDGEPAVDGGPVGYGGAGVWDAATRSIVWSIGSIHPGDYVEHMFDVLVVDPLPPGAPFADVAVVTTTSLPGDVPGERTALTAPEPERYTGTVTHRLAGPVGFVSMGVSPPEPAVGETVDLTVSATLPWDVAAYDTTFLVTLPDGLELVKTLFAGCTVSGSCETGQVTALAPDGAVLGWFVGDVAAVDTVEARQVSVVLRARVVEGAIAGSTLTALGRFAWNEADRLETPTSVADLGTFDVVTDPGPGDVLVGGAAPELEVDAVVVDAGGQPVGARPVGPGEVLTWRVTVTGTGTGAAHDVVVTDTTDPRLGRVSAASGGDVVDGDAGGDGVLAFALPPLAAGTTTTLSYSLRVPWPVPGELVGSLTSAVTVAWRAGPEPDAPAGSAGSASVVLDVRPPGGSLAGRVRVESIVDGSLLGYTEGVRVVVRWLGPDKAPGGGDDVRVPTATDADGRWRVDALRPGWYQVRFDPGTLPPLTLPWRDSDGGAPLVTTVHLSTDQVRPRVNLLLAGVAVP